MITLLSAPSHCLSQLFIRPSAMSIFHVPNLIPIWVDPNDIGSTVDSDVELN